MTTQVITFIAFIVGYLAISAVALLVENRLWIRRCEREVACRVSQARAIIAIYDIING
jgi:hypothetical protein